MTHVPKRSEIIFNESEHRVLVAFGDVLGGQSWTRRCGLGQMKKTFSLMHSEWERFAPHAAMHKSLGDGFMSVWELELTDNSPLVFNLLDTAISTTREIFKIIRDTPVPRPAGWRIRFVCGDALKWSQHIGKRVTHDYLSQAVNLAKELLYVEEQEAIVLHESAFELIPEADRQKFPFTNLPNKKYPNLNILEDDLRNLRALQWN